MYIYIRLRLRSASINLVCSLVPYSSAHCELGNQTTWFDFLRGWFQQIKYCNVLTDPLPVLKCLKAAAVFH